MNEEAQDVDDKDAEAEEDYEGPALFQELAFWGVEKEEEDELQWNPDFPSKAIQ